MRSSAHSLIVASGTIIWHYLHQTALSAGILVAVAIKLDDNRTVHSRT
jgi:hypothetical protein